MKRLLFLSYILLLSTFLACKKSANELYLIIQITQKTSIHLQDFILTQDVMLEGLAGVQIQFLLNIPPRL